MAENLKPLINNDLDIAELEKENMGKEFNFVADQQDDQIQDDLIDLNEEPLEAPRAAPKLVEKPLSPYIIFMKSLKKDEVFQQSLKDNSLAKSSFLSEASKRWNTMTDEEKAPFFKENS